MTVSFKGQYGPFSTWSTSTPYIPTYISWGVADAIGDVNIAYTALKPAYDVFTPPTAPAGWTYLGSAGSSVYITGNDAGSMLLSVFCKSNGGSEPSDPPISYSEAYSPVMYGNYGFTKTAQDWSIQAAFQQDTTRADSYFSVTFPGTPLFKSGDSGLLIFSLTSDSASIFPPTLTIPGCTLQFQPSETSTTSVGYDMYLMRWRFTVTSGIATGSASFIAQVNSSSYAHGPAALIRIGEALPNEHTVVPGTVVVTSPTAKRSLARAAATAVSVVSDPAEVGYNLARTTLIDVESPPASVVATKRYGDMEGELQIDVPTSGVLRAIDPATAASLGRSNGVEVQIWDPTNTTMLAVADGRTDMQWLDDMNDTGQGSFSLPRFDPKATLENLALFNLVRYSYAGVVRFASRIENRVMEIVASGDHEGQVWGISGRGVLALLGDAVLYPEYGINAFTQKERGFSFASKEGPWYVASEWSRPQGLQFSAVGEDHPWKGHPEGWPDPDAWWIWPTDPNSLAAPGPAWFRSYFTLSQPTTVTVYASADDQVSLYVDGYPVLATVGGENHGFLRSSEYSIRMGAGQHLIAAEVLNSDELLEEVQPTISSEEVTPSYATDSNRPYIGKGFTDGGHPYVNGDGSVQDGQPGSAAFDGDENSYWLSVGNYLGWSSAYEFVEGTFSAIKVTAVRIKVHGGPYTVYISLKNGGNNWNGSATIPYGARAVDSGAAIRYVRQIRLEPNQDATINVDPQDADRIRITLKADWDSGIWQYRWRAGVSHVRVTSENRTGTYIRGGNFAGLLVTVATTDSTGAVTGFAHRSQPDGWLAKTGTRPGWLPAHIIIKMLEEAKARNVLGALPLKLGFTAYVDSNGEPWSMARKDVSYNTGDDYVSILRQITEDSEVDTWIEPAELLIHAVPKRGKDRTSEVVLRPGQSLEGLSIDNARPLGTRMMVESEFGWMEVGDFAAEAGIGRVEGFVSLGNALSAEEARLSAVHELSRFSIPSYDATVSHIDTLGPRPYIDYNLGDLITVPTGFEQETDAYRVLSVGISEGDAGDLKVTLEVDREPYALTGPGGGGTGSGADEDNGVPDGTTLKVISIVGKPPAYTLDTLTSTTLTINTNGAIYDGYEFDRHVVVNGNLVQIKNCKFSGPGPTAVNDSALVLSISGQATLDHCTLIPAAGTAGVVGSRGPGLTLVRCEISMVTVGVETKKGWVVVDHCWLHDMAAHLGSGEYGVKVLGGQQVDIVGTRIDGSVATAAVFVENVDGNDPISNISVRDGILGADSQVGVYVSDGSATDEPAIGELRITGNIFERGRQETAIAVSARTLLLTSTVITDNVWNDGSLPPPHAVTGP